MPAVTQMENLTDEELEIGAWILKKIGIAEGYLLPAASIDVEGKIEKD